MLSVTIILLFKIFCKLNFVIIHRFMTFKITNLSQSCLWVMRLPCSDAPQQAWRQEKNYFMFVEDVDFKLLLNYFPQSSAWKSGRSQVRLLRRRRRRRRRWQWRQAARTTATWTSRTERWSNGWTCCSSTSTGGRREVHWFWLWLVGRQVGTLDDGRESSHWQERRTLWLQTPSIIQSVWASRSSELSTTCRAEANSSRESSYSLRHFAAVLLSLEYVFRYSLSWDTLWEIQHLVVTISSVHHSRTLTVVLLY